MRDEKAIAAKKEEILELVREAGTGSEGWDLLHDIAIAGAELVGLEKHAG